MDRVQQRIFAHQGRVWDALYKLLKFVVEQGLAVQRRTGHLFDYDHQGYEDLIHEMKQRATFENAIETIDDDDKWANEYTLGNEILFAPDMFFESARAADSFEDLFGIARFRYAPRNN